MNYNSYSCRNCAKARI